MTTDKVWEDRPGKGTLFINKDKKSQASPDYKGKVLLRYSDLKVHADGTAWVKMSAWIKKTSQGSHLLSISQDMNFTPSTDFPKAVYTGNPGELQRSRSEREISLGKDDSDIPF